MKDFWLAALRREGAAFLAAAANGPLDRPVPSCPKWTVERLVGHLGTVYRWQAMALEAGEAPDRDAIERPPSGSDALSWWEVGFATSLKQLEATDPEQAAWNWSVAPRTAGFWQRRMAHETAVHRWDAQLATALPEPVETDLAADGVAEVLDTFLPSGRRAGEPAEGVATLVASDIDRSWTVRLRGEGVTLLDDSGLFDDEPPAGARAGGTASDLLLFLWGRVPLDTLTMDGDPALLLALRTA